MVTTPNLTLGSLDFSPLTPTPHAAPCQVIGVAFIFFVAGTFLHFRRQRRQATKMAADATKHAEGKCGADGKTAEGKCGADKGKAAGAAAGAKAKTGDKKAAEGKCGEGKCGAKH